jgi:hypothetical protein
VPVTNARLDTSTAVLGYARVLDLWGMSGKFDVTVPYTWLSGTAEFAGRPIERAVDGFGDARFRLSVNVHGAPALTLKEFAEYRQDLIIGASFAVTAPIGRYDPSRAVNLGANRWSFRPELGVSKALGPLTLEYTAGATAFTENTDFLGGRTRAQQPIVSMQGHAIYGFRSGLWASATLGYLTGGRTAIDGDIGDDDLRTFLRHQDGGVGTEARGAAGDQGDLAGQTFGHVFFPPALASRWAI